MPSVPREGKYARLNKVKQTAQGNNSNVFIRTRSAIESIIRPCGVGNMKLVELIFKFPSKNLPYVEKTTLSSVQKYTYTSIDWRDWSLCRRLLHTSYVKCIAVHTDLYSPRNKILDIINISTRRSRQDKTCEHFEFTSSTCYDFN